MFKFSTQRAVYVINQDINEIVNIKTNQTFEYFNNCKHDRKMCFLTFLPNKH